MKAQKKKALNHHIKKLSLKKISMLLYIVISILSIMNHNIAHLSDLVLEIIVYTCLTLSLNTILKNVSIKQIIEEVKLLFN